MAKWVIHGKGPSDLVDAAIPDAQHFAEKVDHLRQSAGLDRLIKTYDIPNGTVTVTALEHVRTVVIEVSGVPIPKEEEKKKPPEFPLFGGYEFTTPDNYRLTKSPGTATGHSAVGFSGIRYTMVALDEKGQMVGVKPDGSLISEGADGYEDQVDAYSFGGQWADAYELYGAATPLIPGSDWFSVPHPATDDDAEFLVGGHSAYQAATIGGCPSHRYSNRMWAWMTEDSGYYTVGSSQNVLWVSSAYFQIVEDGKVLGTTGLPNSMSGTRFASHGGACSVFGYPTVFMAAPYDGGDMKHFYLFVVNSIEPYDVVTYQISMAAYRPSWVKFQADYFADWPDFPENVEAISNQWCWRGDGKRAISIQYDYDEYERPSHRTGDTTPTYTFRECIPGIIEVQALVTFGPLAVNRSRTINKYPMLDQWPLGVEYNMLDSRQRRVAYLEAYLGPVHTHTWPIVDGEPESDGQPTYMRPLLVYLRFATMNDDGTLNAPYFSRPIVHCPWMLSHADTLEPDYDTKHGLEDSSGYAPCGVSTGGAFVALTTANPSFRDEWGYECLLAHIPALDLRADAYILNYQIDVLNGAFTKAEDLRDNVSLRLLQEWGVWGQQRVSKVGAQTTSYDQPTDTWTFGDVEDIEARDAPSFLAGLETLPAGYTKLTPTSPMWNEWSVYACQETYTGAPPVLPLSYLYYGIVFVMEGELEVDTFSGAGSRSYYTKSAYYDGFALNPKKHFAVHSYDHRRFLMRSFTVFPNYIDAVNLKQAAWFLVDHIEKVLPGEDTEPLVDTHYAVYNRSRGTNFSVDSEEPRPEVIRARAMWIE